VKKRDWRQRFSAVTFLRCPEQTCAFANCKHSLIQLVAGRPLISNTEKEQPLKDNQTPYLPKNELFTPIRQRGFQGDTFRSAAKSALSVLDTIGRGSPSLDFDSFREVKSWFRTEPPATKLSLAPLSLLLVAVRFVFRVIQSVLGIKLLAFSFWLSPAADIAKKVHDKLGKWKAPKVYKGRADMWRSDQEYGRQAVAGQNPVTLAALTSLEGTNFTSATVPATLTGGVPIEKLVENARVDPTSCCIFQQDYHTVIADYLYKVNSTYGQGNRVLNATRCLFYADSTTKLVPVAIQIQRTADVASRDVFTPYDGSGVWMLAKMFHANNDSSVHQVVSHWLRSHASMEPFILASRRQLSLAHPLNRLLQKHTTYTLQINANARAGLINAGGVIERTFTPGKYAMEIGARVYGALWRFEKEALPNDLVARGMAVPDESAPSGVRLLDTVDYPFATDALELWQLLEGWFTDYVNMYYSSDEDVVKDNELMAWWDDIKTQGHPDMKEGWPELDGRSSLAKIVTTIVYIASAHHAAVNFGQYDFR
jgi:lipoxygenase